MASKDQNIMLLQEVVGQLRKLNASSVRDRLREAEEAKRAEKIALQGETQEVQQESIVSSSEDFRRRFIAGQAKTFTDRSTKSDIDTRRNLLLRSIDKNIMEGFYFNTAAIETAAGTPQTPVAQAAEAMENPFIGLIKVNTDNLVQNLATLKNINFQMLEFFKTSRKEDDLRFNTQQREQEEARKEAIKLNQRPMAGAAAGGAAGELDLNEPQAGGGAGLGAAAAVVALKVWKWSKLKAAAFLAYGKKLFSKFKNLSPKHKKNLANPRKWPLILAAVIAAQFISGVNDDGDGEDSSDDSVLPGDLPDLPEESQFVKNIDTLLTVGAVGGLLTRSTIVTNVAKTVGDKVRKSYKSAPKTSMRGRLYSNKAFQKGLSLGGRGLLRFMGPWGFGAWVAWEIGRFALQKFDNQEKEGVEAFKEIQDIQTQNIDSVLGDPQLEALFKDPSGPMKFGTTAKKNTIKQRIRMLMEGKSVEQKKQLKKELMTLGWTATELSPLMGNMISTNPMRDKDGLRVASALELKERDRIEGFGMSPGAMGGVVNSGNSYVGDQIIQNSYYVQGNAGGGSAWEGKPGGGIGGGGRY